MLLHVTHYALRDTVSQGPRDVESLANATYQCEVCELGT